MAIEDFYTLCGISLKTRLDPHTSSVLAYYGTTTEDLIDTWKIINFGIPKKCFAAKPACLNETWKTLKNYWCMVPNQQSAENMLGHNVGCVAQTCKFFASDWLS